MNDGQRDALTAPAEAQTSAPAPVWWLALVLFAGHIAVNRWSPFEFQRDEFLYLAMGDHLQWWRMDFPPFIALLANVTRAVAGDSLVAIRLGPAVAASVLVILAARVARTLGGSVAAQWMSAIAVATAPVVLRPGMLYQPVIFDQLWWTCALFALLTRARTGDPRWWLAVGVSLGVGLLTKLSIAFIGVGIVVGVVLTPLRKDLATRWPWLALLVALTIGSATLVGQWRLDFPITWQMRDLNAGQLGRRSIWAFLAEQPFLVSPIGVALAAVGLWSMLAGARASIARAPAIAMLVAWTWLIVSRGKGYYGAPVYPIALAAGFVVLDGLRHMRWRRTSMGAVITLMVLFSAIGMPLTLPVLSPEATARYAQRLGMAEATRTNYGTTLPLPQDYADMLGWKELVAAVAEEWRALPDADRARAVVAASNYGEAGALDHYGSAYGLPRVVSGAGSYWFFGPGDKPGDVLLVLGEPPESMQPLFATCELRRTVGSRWAVDEEQRVPITLCRQPHKPLQVIWPMFNPAL